MRKGLAAIALLLLVPMLGLVPGGLVTPPLAQAEPGPDFQLVTDYPSIVVEPGKTVNLTLRLINKAKVGRRVDLSLTAPKGWKPRIKERGYIIRSVYVGPDDTSILDLEAVPPEGVESGKDYTILIRAVSRDGVDETLAVKIGVREKEVSGTKVVSQYPVLRGPTGSKFEFKIDLTNGTGEEQSYSLSAKAPPGWEVSFQPAFENKQISTIRMKAGETRGLDIEVTSPKRAEAGEYPIDIQVSAGTERISGRLKVILTGTHEMTMATSSGRLNLKATAGSQAPLSILIGNTGSAELNDISLSSSKPSGWEVTFDPKTVDGLAPGATREVNVWIKPDGKAIAGDYLVTIYASNPQVSKNLELRVTVETPTIWGWVGIGIVVVVMGGLYGVFRVLGRR
jgi:uncharacterized membrane protein